FCFFFQAEDGIRDLIVTGVQTCALPICSRRRGGLAEGVGPPRPRSCGRRWAERGGRAGSGPPRPAASALRPRRCAPRSLRPEGRSEERRVGKEWRAGRGGGQRKRSNGKE